MKTKVNWFWKRQLFSFLILLRFLTLKCDFFSRNDLGATSLELVDIKNVFKNELSFSAIVGQNKKSNQLKTHLNLKMKFRKNRNCFLFSRLNKKIYLLVSIHDLQTMPNKINLFKREKNIFFIFECKPDYVLFSAIDCIPPLKFFFTIFFKLFGRHKTNIFILRNCFFKSVIHLNRERH